MMLKFTPMRFSVSIKKNSNTLFEMSKLNDFSIIDTNIKSLFGWFRKTEGGSDIVNPRQYGDKYIVVKYYNGSKEQISLIEKLNKGTLSIMCLQVAEENKINEYKEIVEDGKVQFRISNKQKIFEDYYVGIYLSNSSIEEENGIVYTGYVFSVQKGRNSIKEVLKNFIADIYPDCSISLDYQTTKKKAQQFQEAVKKVVIKAKIRPEKISPDLVSEGSGSTNIDVRMELIIKKKKETVLDKGKNAIDQFRSYSKDVLTKAIDRQPFDMDKREVRAKIGNQEVGLEVLDDEIMCLLRDDKEIKSINYSYDGFKLECRNYFNQ